MCKYVRSGEPGAHVPLCAYELQVGEGTGLSLQGLTLSPLAEEGESDVGMRSLQVSSCLDRNVEALVREHGGRMTRNLSPKRLRMSATASWSTG